MKNTLCTTQQHRAWGFIATRAKCLLALGMAAVGLASSRAESLQSPHGAETFAVVGPPMKRVQLAWKFPVQQETPDLVFKVYQSTTLSLPLRVWSVLTNIPGNLRAADVIADKSQAFFTITASNYFGESGYATR